MRTVVDVRKELEDMFASKKNYFDNFMAIAMSTIAVFIYIKVLIRYILQLFPIYVILFIPQPFGPLGYCDHQRLFV